MVTENYAHLHDFAADGKKSGKGGCLAVLVSRIGALIRITPGESEL